MEELIINCPSCKDKMFYKNKKCFLKAIQNNKCCIRCTKLKNKLDFVPTRLCPKCNKNITYTQENNRETAERKKTLCSKCGIKNRRSYSGINNPFFGKHHNDTVKNKLSDFNKNKRILSEEFIELARKNLSKVTNCKPIYSIWLEKYGKEDADKKWENFIKKQSDSHKGSKNSMFGKPAPQGSGNGWSGWYKNWLFRSLRELSYMINVIEEQGLSWNVATKDYKITYIDYNGITKNYFPDFIIGNKIIEIKPKKLHHSPKVLIKKMAAESFAKNHNMIYELIDPPLLSLNKIKDLYLNKDIKFLDKYEVKFKERYLNA